ncbi:serine protease [Rickettsiales bacterium]|nr:serine protease [Rickettsiales bacterium]
MESLIPTVVNISTIQKTKKPDVKEMPFIDPFQEFRDFFDRFGPFMDAQPEREIISLGSGFIISDDGLIVTNNHVIENASEITVRFSDDSEAKAELLAWDAKTDIALLKVEVEHKLPYAEFGDSDNLRVGDAVLAIGNPFGFGSSVSAGIVSARARTINSGPFDDFLQIDAAINRGNSGGPLFDVHGKVAGVNTAIATPSGGSVGVGFAVNSNLVKFVAENLQKHGRVIRGWIGVKIQAITKDIAESIGQKDGALVAEVMKDSPAEKAGVSVGDIILEFDGIQIKEMRQLPKIAAYTPISKKVKISVLRNGKKITLHAKVEEMEDGHSAEKQDSTAAEPAVLGMFLEDFDKDTRKSYNIPKYIKNGIIVSGVKRGSQAEKKGIKRGNVIARIVTRASDTEIHSIKDFKQQLEAAKKSGNNSVLLLVVSIGASNSGSSFVVLNLE